MRRQRNAGSTHLAGLERWAWEEKGSRRKGRTITGGRVPPAKADAVEWGPRRWAEMEESERRK